LAWAEVRIGVEIFVCGIPEYPPVTVTAVPYLMADTTLLAVDEGLVKFTPEILVVMFVTGVVVLGSVPLVGLIGLTTFGTVAAAK